MIRVLFSISQPKAPLLFTACLELLTKIRSIVCLSDTFFPKQNISKFSVDNDKAIFY